MIIFTVVNKNTKYTLSFINLISNYRTFIFDNNSYHYIEIKKFKDYFIEYIHYKNKLKIIKYLNYSGNLHREYGHAWIEYYKNGGIRCRERYINGKAISL